MNLDWLSENLGGCLEKDAVHNLLTRRGLKPIVAFGPVVLWQGRLMSFWSERYYADVFVPPGWTFNVPFRGPVHHQLTTWAMLFGPLVVSSINDLARRADTLAAPQFRLVPLDPYGWDAGVSIFTNGP